MNQPKKSFIDTEKLPAPLKRQGKVYGKDIIDNLWSLLVGAGNKVFGADISGIWAGSSKFDTAPFKVDMDGNLTATNVNITGYLPISGGTLSGDLILKGAPTSNLMAATKKYVDDQVAGVPVNTFDYTKIVGNEDQLVMNNDEMVYNL